MYIENTIQGGKCLSIAYSLGEHVYHLEQNFYYL